MKNRLAFVLSGGGARGALQVGAIRALLEAGLQPGILVGTSIGAANAVILGLHGVSNEGLDKLEEIYEQSAEVNILPNDYLRLALRTLFRRPASEPSERIYELLLKNGITPELKFKDLKYARVMVVATDLNHYERVVYGLNPEDSVLDGLVASTAIPPWVVPIQRDDRLLLDGGVISNLPVEPALLAKPREIIALDVQELRDIPGDNNGFAPLFNKLVTTIQKRQIYLEMAVAEASGVPVRYLHLYAERPIAVYQFEFWRELVERGYEQARIAIKDWDSKRQLQWWKKLKKVWD